MTIFKKISFKQKLLLTVSLACLICGAVSLGVGIHYSNNEFIQGLIEKSRIIHGRLEEVAKYIATQGGLDPVIQSMTKKYKSPSEISPEDKEVILRQVPIYGAMKVGNENSEKDNYSFRVFSNEPRNDKNMATATEMEIFRKFENDQNLKEFVSEKNNTVTVYRPVRLHEKSGCLTCHGNPSRSPWGNGLDILGHKMENWGDGKLHGVFAVSNDVAAIKKSQASMGGTSSTVMLTLFIVLGSIVALFIAAFVIRGPIKTLSTISQTLAQAGDLVSDTSEKIASTSEKLSQSATLQASSLSETTASLEEINAMIHKATENAEITVSSSEESQRRAENGRNVVEHMLTAMSEINQSNEDIVKQVNDSNRQMGEIVKVIQEIGDKTKVINEIVFQTKLLSFNASVEAARAGEQGKGFAVVAEEVGNLAQMSGNAAKEITELLSTSISRVESIVNETTTQVGSLTANGRKKVELGINVANQCADILNEIVNNVSTVSTLAKDISQASKEQSLGVSEINKAMNQLDAATNQNSHTSEQAAAAAEDLFRQAGSLKDAVNHLIDLMEGTNSSSSLQDHGLPDDVSHGEPLKKVS